MKSLFGLLSLILLSQQLAFASSGSRISVTPTRLSMAEFYEKYTAVGQARLASSKNYFAKVSGTVDFVSNAQGGTVSKNDVIITITRDTAEKLKAQAEAKLQLAESNHKRNLSLLQKKITSQENVNESKAALEQARNEHIKALNSYEDMVIKAVDDGQIGAIRTNVGDEVKTGDYLFSLTSKSNFYILVELPEALRNQVSTADSVKIKGPRGLAIEGKIVAVSGYLSNNGTITARLEFPYTEHLAHGAFVETEIIFNKHTALALPEKAILKNNQGSFVYLITPENLAKQTFVTLGVRTDNMIELLSDNLHDGDNIVLSGLTKVFDGAELIIKDSSNEPGKSPEIK